jgi:hypothetical protein
VIENEETYIIYVENFPWKKNSLEMTFLGNDIPWKKILWKKYSLEKTFLGKNIPWKKFLGMTFLGIKFLVALYNQKNN